jgi:hypothetical protein
MSAESEQNVLAENVQAAAPGGQNSIASTISLGVSEELAAKLDRFLSSDNILNAGWVAHNANNET